MKNLLMTGWSGTQHGMMAAHTAPLLEDYAHAHGMAFCCINLQSRLAPPSWMKVPNMIAALEDYDWVLWVDCDVVVMDKSQNIVKDVHGIQGLVKHKTECGEVPNCGVWVVSQGMKGVLSWAWDKMLPVYRDHPWWEQAAMLNAMGYEVLAGPSTADRKSTELRRETTFLRSRWNHHPRDAWRTDDDVAFFHVTQYDDRLGTVAAMSAKARGE
jgi:hypothetical protein